MIIYSSSAREFRHSVDENRIALEIENAFVRKLGKRPSPSEKQAWNHSMRFMETVIRNARIPDDCGILIEYNLPTTSKRIDFIVTGQDEQENDNFIIVELKQWESAEATDKKDVVLAVYGGRQVETTHPSYQAWSYLQFLRDMNEAVYTQDLKGYSCAYLHNYRERSPEPLKEQRYADVVREAPLFFAHDVARLQDYIRRHVGKGKGMSLLYEIENGKIRPSKKLVDHVSSLFEGNQAFILLDEQKLAYETIMSLAGRTDRKRTIIVKGGPGTGKSVVSMNVFAGLIRKRLNVKFVAPNQAFREVMAETLSRNRSGNKMRIRMLFAGSGQFYHLPDNLYDVLIVDEAHRLKGKGAYQYQGENQIEDIVKASRVNVFFIDDYQRIRPDDIGTVAEIRRIAEKCRSEVYELHLAAQFRCSGAEGFLNWIDDVLQIRPTANFSGWDRDAFEFELMDSPHRVFEKLKEKQRQGFKARLLAGYAWEWTPEKEGNRNGEVPDVVIEEHDFRMPWNGHAIRSIWAIHEDGVNQIGCVHTTQGLEFDYVGVIIGYDLKFDPERMTIYADYEEYKDKSGKRGLKYNPSKLAELVKNVYRILISRGMKGCYLYCRDKNLQEYIRQRLQACSFD